MGSEFIMNSEMMQKIFISRYPVLLIDESQDTKKELIDALLELYEKHKDKIIIGLFCDTMQKIYADGKDNLAICIPDDWEKFTKVMNHRSSKRIVALANAIRENADGRHQESRSDAEPGKICLFIADIGANKSYVEKRVPEIMVGLTGDDKWLIPKECKRLILEHHMAGRRLGFIDLFSPLYEIDSFRTGILDGSLPEISLFTKIILPLVKANQAKQDFDVAKIVRQYSPLLDKKSFIISNVNQTKIIAVAEKAVNDLCTLWNNGQNPKCIDILVAIEKSGLFKIPEYLQGIISYHTQGEVGDKIHALKTALSVSFDQIENYNAYINGETPFETHQGVKGLEFPRVTVIMDDQEARGFLFSYEKLFGAKEKTDTDLKNELEGKDTSIARTTRLFYVACTRAQKSLALIAYTDNVNAVRSTALANGWFKEDEIVILG